MLAYFLLHADSNVYSIGKIQGLSKINRPATVVIYISDQSICFSLNTVLFCNDTALLTNASD
jgi:hypothetical protein